jgi:ABC-type Fe3+-siderophore transport system permease subunit
MGTGSRNWSPIQILAPVILGIILALLYNVSKYNPSLKLARDIAKALHTTIDELSIFEEEQ